MVEFKRFEFSCLCSKTFILNYWELEHRKVVPFDNHVVFFSLH